MVESLAAAGHSTDPGETRATTELMRLLVPRNVVQSLRVRQYLLRLSRTWYEAALTGDIVLFDQGFVQAVYTSAQVAEVADSERIGLALDAVPEADLLIRLHAPLQILVARLAERRRRQGSIERLLDRWTNFGSLGVFDEIHELLRARGRPVICIDSTDKCSLRRGMDQVQRIMVRAEDEVSVGSGPEQGGTGL
jgi:thymidylate kinase